MWDEFEQLVNEMFGFVNGKKVVLWGYERSGWFIEHLFRRYNKQIEYIVDDSVNMSFDMDDAMFDFGCGKGNILPLCIKAGINKFGGVEYDPELYQIACDNFRKVGYDIGGLINGDASLICKELDCYNIFFIANSFVGTTFDKVIKNIQESYDRIKRKIFLIYGGTYCHESVLKYSNFQLSKVIDTDYWVRNVNIYMIPDNV